MSNFKNLRVYKQSLTSIKLLFELINEPMFKNDFSLKDQLKRASMSVTANIAEGYSRNTSKDRCHFLTIALGSTNEVVAFLDIIEVIYKLNLSKLQEEYSYLGKQIYNLRKCIHSDRESS